MEIKHKLYPYPVLSPYSNDYKSSVFDVAIDPARDGYNLRIDFTASLTCSELMELIKMQKAKFVYHLECAQTGFRKIVKTDKGSLSYPLMSKNVNGKLQICPFVAAVEDISGYSSPDFHEDYVGMPFNIEAGCILAAGKMVTVDISKNIDDLIDIPSIFGIVRNADASVKQMLVDMRSRKIVIMLPMEQYYSYKQLSKTPQAQDILNTLTVVPALVYVLGKLGCMSVQERGEHEEQAWYKSLSKTLLKQFDVDIESEEFSSCDYMKLAQELINDPMEGAFRLLTDGLGTSGGEDE